MLATWVEAIPLHLIVAVFTSAGWTITGVVVCLLRGLNGLMVLLAAVVLLFTARYPKPIYGSCPG